MNNRGQTVTHHYFWMITLVFIFLVCVWIYANNRPDQYEKGSIHAEQHRQDWPFSIHVAEGGCARMDSLKGVTNAVLPAKVRP